MQDDPVIVFNTLTFDPSRQWHIQHWWDSEYRWGWVHNFNNYNFVENYIAGAVTGMMNAWYEQNKANWRYLDIKYHSAFGDGLQGIINYAVSSVDWWFSWGGWWFFDPIIAFSFEMPEITLEYGTEVWPEPRLVTPPSITVDPDPFAIKLPAVNNLNGIRGRLVIDGGEDTGTDNDTVVVHANGSTFDLSGSLVNVTEGKTDAAGTTVTTDYLNLRGLGLTSGSVNGDRFDGVLLQNLENFDVLLGERNDQFTLDAHPIGATTALTGQLVKTRVSLGDGDDQVSILQFLGETFIYGGAGDDTVTVNADQNTTALIVGKLHVDGNGEIFEQSQALTYNAAFHDPIVAAVPYVAINTRGGTEASPVAQTKDKILSANRTSVVSIIGNLTGVSTSGNIVAMDVPVDVYWTEATVTLTGPAVGERWALLLDGIDFGFTPATGATLASVATQLAALANGAVAGVGVTYSVTAVNGVLTVRRSDNSAFTVSILRSYDKAADIVGTPMMDFTQFRLSGTVTAGSVWSISYNGVTRSVTAGSADTLQTIAQALKTQAGAAGRVNQYLDLYVLAFDPISGLPAQDIIQRRGVQATGYQETGFQLRGRAYLAGTGGLEQQYEDAEGNLTSLNTGKPIFIIDQSNAASVALFIDGLGRLTTANTGLQALRVIEGNRLPMAFYRNTSGPLSSMTSNWAQGALVTSSNPIAPGLATIRPLYFDNSGNKSVSVPLADQGYQEKGYQLWGYYKYSDGTKSTTAIAAGYTVVVDFNDAISVPLYVRVNAADALEVTTERVANQALNRNLSGVEAAYQFFLSTHSGFDTTRPLYMHRSAVAATVFLWVVTDNPFEGLHPFVETYSSGGLVVNPDGTNRTTPSGASETYTVVPLYLDANGNLTTTVTSTPDWRKGFQRTYGSGSSAPKMFLDVNGNPVSGSGYRQAIVVVNELLYLDGEGSPTQEPTNNRQFVTVSTTDARRGPLYSDSAGVQTTSLVNASIVVTNTGSTS
ncbi:MAG: hypothetical protein WCO67_17045, partial [Betaproteobacteria bacterium]